MTIKFSEEQQAEIDKMLTTAKAQEQYKIAGLQAFRESLAHMSQLIDQYDMTQNPPRLVKQGAYVPMVYDVLVDQFNKFIKDPSPLKREPAEPAAAEQEPKDD